MHLTKLKYILSSILLLLSLSAWAKGGSAEKEQETAVFNEETILKKGVTLSELGILGDKRIKFTEAMRFDANYIPSPEGTVKPVNLPLDQIQKHVKRAHDALTAVKESEMYTTVLEGKNITLPVGIKKPVGNKDVTICLDSLIFTPTYAYAVLYVIIEDTKNDKTLAFYGKDIRFTKNGGFTGDARLELLETYDLNFGQTAKVTFLVDQTHENYVIFDCNGFKKLHIDSRIYFSQQMFVAEDAAGKVIPGKQVTTDFMADFESLDNFMVQISNVPAFQVVGMEGTSFKINTLAFDYSSALNPSGIIFPANYDHPSFASGQNFWEGFYIDGLTIKLPEEFKLKNSTSGNRITIVVNNALIDKLGFTGNLQAQNVIPKGNGDMGGWDYSVDVISVNFLKSSLTSAEFRGSLAIPITKETEAFNYTALIQPGGQYNFTVAMASNLSFPMFGAGGVAIYQDSWINVQVANKKFTPNASLNGMMSIGAGINGAEGQAAESNADNKLALAEIKFQKLRISTVAPYLWVDQNGGSFGVGSPALQQKMARLPVTIKDVMMVTAAGPDRTGIKFTVCVNLVGNSDSGGGFSGNATLTVWGKNNPAGTKPKYSFYKVELNRIELNNIKIAVLTLGGYIEFYRDDPAYGSGFSGGINIKLELGAGEIGIAAKCIFGKKPMLNNPSDIYRYWAVDMLVSLPSIPIFPGIVYLNAIGGGASYRMGMDRTNSVPNPKFVSNSGVVYLPNETKGLGLKALLGIQGQTRKAYEGQLIFEVLFNVDGGLSQVSFSGYVQIASLGNGDQLAKLKSSVGGFVDKVKLKPDGVNGERASGSEIYGEISRMADGGALMAQWMMVYDRDNSSFTANIDIFVDVFGIIKGVNPNAHAGRVDILFTPKKWHVFAGLPSYPMGISVMDFVSITTYFMMGHDLQKPLKMPVPGAPEPNFPFGADGQAASGQGFGMGARLHIGASGGGAFYYSVGADAGFDILIWNVAGQYCNGKPKGVKGWYGMGQVFFYAYASAGLRTCVNIPYPCGCESCHSCSRRCWRPWCWGCSWCHSESCVDISATLDLGFYGQIEAANPTYAEGAFIILGRSVTVKGGKRCQ